MRKGWHRCPRKGCEAEVPNSIYACFADWQALSGGTRAKISRTASLPTLSPERRNAFDAAERDWRRQ